MKDKVLDKILDILIMPLAFFAACWAQPAVASTRHYVERLEHYRNVGYDDEISDLLARRDVNLFERRHGWQ